MYKTREGRTWARKSALPRITSYNVCYTKLLRAEAARLVAGFLDASAIPHTLRKTASALVFSVSDKGRKKRNVLEASVPASVPATGIGGPIVDLVCGPKYDLRNNFV